MAFYADLHVHSKHSRATSRQCDLEHLFEWGRRKGISVVGTGDFTHPVWRAELGEKLVPAEPGLFRLLPELERKVEERLPRACRGTTRFALTGEISTIYKKGERTRKIHHLICAPDLDSVGRLVASLEKIGNLASDGRPILGLDSRHLLEMVLEAGRDCALIPAHVWTPWFAALGSKSGFDSIEDCYDDLSEHVFAIETGLSSDPPMNWRVSSLDRFRLVSNSDAHSPDKLGREACVFDCQLDYPSILAALRTGRGYVGTVEFFPEEGKYHLDGHRACSVRLSPGETRALGGRCPICTKPVTVGVMHRVEELADRGEGERPETAGEVRSLVPLPEILSELHGTGSRSQSVARIHEGLLERLGPELPLLEEVPLEEIQRCTSSLVAEAIARLRRRQVIREAGYDGEYGRIRLFEEEELLEHRVGGSLFGPLEPRRRPRRKAAVEFAPAPRREEEAAPAEPAELGSIEGGALAGLDPVQREAVEHETGPLLVVAGPGSGKTRTLTHRIAHLVAERGAAPDQCLAITFTRRAAEEMRERLERLLPEAARAVPVCTFHSLGLRVLAEHRELAGLPEGFRVLAESERLALLRGALECSPAQARRWLSRISRAKRTGRVDAADLRSALEVYREALADAGRVDFDDLVGRAVRLLQDRPELVERWRKRHPFVFVDEYQDVDGQQYRLLRLLVLARGNLCAIGDPNQAIYGFRGADVRFFGRFEEDFPGARAIRLTRNYRSAQGIVAASSRLIGEDAEAPAGSTSSVFLRAAASERAEAEQVVQTIEERLGGHSFFSIDSGRTGGDERADLSFADFAVLYRTDAQSGALIEALERSGMPFQKRSHEPITAHAGVVELVSRLQAAPGSGSVLERLESAAGEEAELLEALEILKPIAASCGEDLARFESEVALKSQVDTWDPRADRISLLTLHAAKGLEFGEVFIVGCEDGILPLRFGPSEDAEVEEERRLFYVGMTRARRRLYLSHARKRPWRGKVREMEPSPFLTGIGEDLMVRQVSERPKKKVREDPSQLELF